MTHVLSAGAVEVCLGFGGSGKLVPLVRASGPFSLALANGPCTAPGPWCLPPAPGPWPLAHFSGPLPIYRQGVTPDFTHPDSSELQIVCDF